MTPFQRTGPPPPYRVLRAGDRHLNGLDTMRVPRLISLWRAGMFLRKGVVWLTIARQG